MTRNDAMCKPRIVRQKVDLQRTYHELTQRTYSHVTFRYDVTEVHGKRDLRLPSSWAFFHTYVCGGVCVWKSESF